MILTEGTGYGAMVEWYWQRELGMEQWWNDTDKENLNKEQCWNDNDGGKLSMEQW